MNSLISGLAGAGGAANTAGGYYQDALNRESNSTGSPAAQQFAQSESNSLQPQFNKQDQQMAARLAAMGITNSGAGKNDFSGLVSDQSATLAGLEAPLWSQALAQYGSINAAEPGAQMNAYQNAINNFYTGISDASSLAAGMPPTAQPNSNPYSIPDAVQVPATSTNMGPQP